MRLHEHPREPEQWRVKEFSRESLRALFRVVTCVDTDCGTPTYCCAMGVQVSLRQGELSPAFRRTHHGRR